MHGEHLPEWAQEMYSALDERMGLQLTEVSVERVAARVPVAGNTQVTGIWHGGASGVVVESLGSIAAYAHGLTLGRVAVGVDLNVTHHRAGVGEYMTAVATPLHLGGMATTHQVAVRDDQGRLVATGRLTCMLVKPRG